MSETLSKNPDLLKGLKPLEPIPSSKKKLNFHFSTNKDPASES